MLGEQGSQKTSKPWEFFPPFFYLQTRSLFLLKRGSFRLGPNTCLYLVVWGASIISLTFRGASVKLPAMWWNECFFCCQWRYYSGSRRSLPGSPKRRCQEYDASLSDNTIDSRSALRSARRYVTHTERVWRVYDWKEPLLQKLMLSALRVFANHDDWNLCIVLH